MHVTSSNNGSCSEDTSITPASSQAQRSAEYYFKSGAYIFQVENTLFRLEVGLLLSKINAFGEMFSMLPRTSSETGQACPDGLNDSDPIVLQQVTAKEFQYLCDWIYGKWTRPPYKLEYLISVLKLSKFWDIDSGREWATYHFQQIESTIRPALRLRIARVYEIDAWVRPAFTALLSIPLRDLTEADHTWLGWDTYRLLACVQQEISDLRVRMAFMPPDIKHLVYGIATCSEEKHINCVRAWKDEWVRIIGPQLCSTHPGRRLKMSEAMDEIKKLGLKAMTPRCRSAAIDQIEFDNIFSGEADLIAQALDALQAVCVDAHEAISVEGGIME